MNTLIRGPGKELLTKLYAYNFNSNFYGFFN